MWRGNLTICLCTSLLALANMCATNAVSQNVHSLTDETFDQETTKGLWLVEFFAPWCSHCKDLEPTWEALADELQGQVNVAKIDGTSERGLVSRFGVNGFPMIFHIHGRETRQFNGRRTLNKLKDFALHGWKRAPKLPAWRSPTSPLGRVWGRIQSWPQKVHGYYTYLHKEKGYSQMTLLASLLALPFTIGLTLICMLDAYITRQPPVQRPRLS